MTWYKNILISVFLISAVALGSGAITLTPPYGSNATITGGTGKFDVIDAGVALINGELRVLGPLVCASTAKATSLTITSGSNTCILDNFGFGCTATDKISLYNSAAFTGTNCGVQLSGAQDGAGLINIRVSDSVASPNVATKVMQWCNGGSSAACGTELAYVLASGAIGYKGSLQDGQFDLEASGSSNSTTNFADVTGLTWTANINTTYRIDCYIIYTSTATTTGVRFGINGPASPTLVDITVDYQGAAIAAAAAPSTAYYEGAHLIAYDTGTATTGVQATGTNTYAHLWGVVRNGANSGTMAIRHASETANSTSVIARSYCRIH